MRTDTGTHDSVKLRPHKTPLRTRQAVETAANDMLKSNNIKRSHLAWSFFTLIIKKNKPKTSQKT